MRIQKKIWLLIIVGFYCTNIAAKELCPIILNNIIDFAESKRKALAFSQKDNQLPVESDCYLQYVVNHFKEHIHYTIILPLKRNEGEKSIHEKEVEYLFNKSSMVNSLRQAHILLSRVTSARKSLILDYQPDSIVIQEYEHVYCTVLLQSSVLLVKIARQQFLDVLDDVSYALRYWREQKNSPTKYFFRKSPLKIMFGKKQSQEIDDNIQKLEKLQFYVRSILGKMTKHIYSLEGKITVDECFNWVEQLLSIIGCLSNNSIQHTVEGDTDRFEHLVHLLRLQLKRVSYYESVLFQKVSSAHIPNHIARNWLFYVITIATLYKGHNCYIHNTEDIMKIISRCSTELVGLWENITNPIKDAWNTIFEDTSLILEKDIQDPLTEYQMQIQERLPRLDQEASYLTQLSEQSGGINIKEQGLNRLKGLSVRFSSYITPHLIEKAQNGEFAELDDLYAQLGFPMNATLKGDLGIALAELKLDYPIEYASAVGRVLEATSNIIVPIAYSTERVLDLVNKFIDESKRSAKPARLSLKLFTLIPAFFITYGAKKAYNWATTTDYSPLRLALFEINSLFIESQAPLNDHDYGKLIYLLLGLKKKTLYYVPKKHNLQSDFLTDIAKLESQRFDVKTKRHIIKNMFNKYAFLSA